MITLAEDILDLFQKAIDVASPNFMFRSFYKEHPEVVDSLQKGTKNLYVFALGKAAYCMGMSFSNHFPINRGFILTKYGHLPSKALISGEDSIWKYREASHPIPDQNSISHSEEVLRDLISLGENDCLVVLLSGGGSSLFEIPVDGISLYDLIRIQNDLLRSGKPIQEINKERKKYSQVKGGKLLQHLNPRLEVFTFVISDVLGDDPATIASGPTFPSQNYYILGNLTRSIQKIKQEAERLGYRTKLISDTWDKTSEETSLLIEKEFLSALESEQRQIILLGGEMVCPVLGNGVGGRNQETALRVAILLNQHQSDRQWCFLSGGTDGTDGPTDAAGGIVTHLSFRRMLAKGWDPKKELENSNSYPVLKSVDSLVMTGPTGTNVNDILILLVEGTKS